MTALDDIDPPACPHDSPPGTCDVPCGGCGRACGEHHVLIDGAPGACPEAGCEGFRGPQA